MAVPVCCEFWETAGRGRVLSPQFDYNNHLFTRRNFLPSFSVEGIESLFGHEAAENEKPERLRQYYFKGKVYEAITADLPLRILVGHKGTGKSALFAVAQAEDVDAGRVSLAVRPDDISGIQASDEDFNSRILSWKVGLSQVIQSLVLNSLGLSADGIKQPINIAGKFLKTLKDVARPYIQNKVATDPIEKLFAERFLKTHSLTIYIDDLDRGWEGRTHDIKRISALLNALRDLSGANSGLKFRVALRSDVYFAVRTSDESTDKIEGSVVWHSWQNHDILVLLAKRVATHFGDEFDEPKVRRLPQIQITEYLQRVIIARFMGQGRWANIPIHRVLMTMVRQRPRDLVKLCSLAANHARDNGRDIIMTDDLKSIFDDYSQGRLQDTFNEYRTELPEIDRLLLGMKPSKRTASTADSYLFTTEQLLTKIKAICAQGKFQFSNKRVATPQDLAAFMYKIDFLIARRDQDNSIERKYFETHRYISSKFADFGYDWEIHPAYRWALQPTSIAELFNQIAPFEG